MKRIYSRILLTVLTLAIIVSCLFAATACDEKRTEAPYTPETFGETRIYELDTQATRINDEPFIALLLPAVLDIEKSYFEFGADGRVRGQLVTLPIDKLIESMGAISEGFSKEGLNAELRAVDLADGLKENVEPMFPGFIAHIVEGDISGAMALVQNSIGMNISGFDLSDEATRAAFVKMGEEYKNTQGQSMHLPSNLLDIIPAGSSLSLTVEWEYNIVRQKGSDGTAHDAIYIGGETAHSTQTQPFGIFSMSMDKNGNETLTMRIEFLSTSIALKLRTK